MSHPSPFSLKMLKAIRSAAIHGGEDLEADTLVLDPFCGSGRVAQVSPHWRYYGAEIEDDWAAEARSAGVNCLTISATALPWKDELFDLVITSPCLGNRLADSYAPAATEKHKMRRTYRIALGHPLLPENTGGLPWGPEYRIMHRKIWAEVRRVLKPKKLLIFTAKDHIRKGKLIPVSAWHLETIEGLGFTQLARIVIPVLGDQNTNTMRSRGVQVVEHENVFVLRLTN